MAKSLFVTQYDANGQLVGPDGAPIPQGPGFSQIDPRTPFVGAVVSHPETNPQIVNTALPAAIPPPAAPRKQTGPGWDDPYGSLSAQNFGGYRVLETKMTGAPAVTFGPPSEMAMREFVKSKMKPQRGFNFGRLVADLGSNMAGKSGSVNDEFFGDLQNRENAAPEIAAKNQMLQDSMDPGSDISRTYRDIVKNNMGFNVPETMSAAKLRDMMGPMSKIWDEQLDRQMKLASIRGANATAGEDPNLAIPGFKSDPKYRSSPASVEKLREGKEQYDSLMQNLAQYRKMIEEHGPYELVGKAAGEMESLHGRMLMQLKKIDELGVINGPDLGLLEKALPSPSSWSSLTTGGTNALARIDTFRKAAENSHINKMAARGYSPASPQSISPAYAQDADAMKWVNDPANANDPRLPQVKARLGVK